MCAGDELTWFRREDPARLRGEVGRHLVVTDEIGTLPDGGSLATDRALAGARLRLLPEPARPRHAAAAQRRQRDELLRAFLAAPEAARFGLTRCRRRRARLTALLPEPAAGPRGELPGRRPAALEPGGGGALPA